MFTKSDSPLVLCSVVLLIMYMLTDDQHLQQLNNQFDDESDMDASEGCLVCLNFTKVINSSTVLLLLSFTIVNLDPMCKQKQSVSDIQNWSFHWRVAVQKYNCAVWCVINKHCLLDGKRSKYVNSQQPHTLGVKNVQIHR